MLGQTAKQIALISVIALLFACSTMWWRSDELDQQGEITIEQAQALAGQVLWVDARSPDEYRLGHIQGAINLSISEFDGQFPDFLERWMPELMVIVYCGNQDCGASRELAAKLLLEYGIEQVYVLKGGWEEWLRNPN